MCVVMQYDSQAKQYDKLKGRYFEENLKFFNLLKKYGPYAIWEDVLNKKETAKTPFSDLESEVFEEIRNSENPENIPIPNSFKTNDFVWFDDEEVKFIKYFVK
jgi:hypothetical protein